MLTSAPTCSLVIFLILLLSRVIIHMSLAYGYGWPCPLTMQHPHVGIPLIVGICGWSSCADGPHGSLLAPCCRKLLSASCPVREEIMNHLLKSKHLILNVPAFTAVLVFSSGNDYLRGKREKNDGIYGLKCRIVKLWGTNGVS